MFGYRTPLKTQPTASIKNMSPERAIQSESEGGNATKEDIISHPVVRRSIGEIEARIKTPPSLQSINFNSKNGSKNINFTNTTDREKSPQHFKNKIAEARGCLIKVKTHINNSRNLRTDLKNGILEAVDRLYALVKETEEIGKEGRKLKNNDTSILNDKVENKILSKLEEHSRVLKQNREEIEKLNETIKRCHDRVKEGVTYANVTAGPQKGSKTQDFALHSVVVTSENDIETGDQVVEKIRKVLNAKEEGVKIDKLRKAKDRKIIIGCKEKSEIEKIRNKIKMSNEHLKVEPIKNKDPLVIVYGVLQVNTDEEILKAIRTQNNKLFEDITEDQNRMEIKFRKKARNPHTTHVVIKVSPLIWKRLTETGVLHIDLQKVKVTDQSPLIQCSRCLGYGHGKRFCTENDDICSHCGGKHTKNECEKWHNADPPSCTNCTKDKSGNTEHNAFSMECPVRRKWDNLARSSITYC